MKMMSSTNTTSTNGVMLMSERDDCVRPWEFVNAIYLQMRFEFQVSRYGKAERPQSWVRLGLAWPRLETRNLKRFTSLQERRSPSFLLPAAPPDAPRCSGIPAR